MTNQPSLHTITCSKTQPVLNHTHADSPKHLTWHNSSRDPLCSFCHCFCSFLLFLNFQFSWIALWLYIINSSELFLIFSLKMECFNSHLKYSSRRCGRNESGRIHYICKNAKSTSNIYGNNKILRIHFKKIICSGQNCLFINPTFVFFHLFLTNDLKSFTELLKIIYSYFIKKYSIVFYKTEISWIWG